MKVLHVVGARPNFMKTTPLMAEMVRDRGRFEQVLVHTGQHYNYNMSKIFFEDLDMVAPNEFLNVGSGTHAEQTARIMLAFEPVVLKHQPDWVVVVGDVNSTVACALVCAKLGVRVAHVEAGLRSGDRTMPEEINRLLTDQIADLLLTPSRDADANLRREGVAESKIHFVGNVMIDTLVRLLPQARQRPVLSALNLEPQRYILVTLHRPSNVDDPAALKEILASLAQVSGKFPVIFPVHPRTRQNIDRLDWPARAQVRLLEPFGYLDFIALEDSARLAITDSGGVQEETTYLGVPCLTIRPNTERPITLQLGTNRLIDNRCTAIVSAVDQVLSAPRQPATRLEYWDGHAAQRIVQIMRELA
jgi:UDP-N-acetylglucosamine 2-epimerase (non-hydrolysing)